MMGKVLKPFVYVPVKSQGPHYLERKFAKMAADKRAAEKAEAARIEAERIAQEESMRQVTPIRKQAK